MTRIATRIGFVFSALAIAAIAWSETVKYSALEELERSFETKLGQNAGKYPFDVLFNAPGVYIPGMGLTLTSRISLVYTQQPSPFRPAFSDQEKATLREHKLEKVPILEQNMREVMSDAAASPSFDAIPGSEHISLGVSLFYYLWENQEGLPHQITMTAEKQQLLKARRDKADLAKVIQEQIL
jgi:hypothetical protein